MNDELAVAIEDMKFAQITEAAGDDLIDDETSPIDSLMSSCDSDEIMTKKNKKKINDSIKEQDILDEMPILDFSGPISPGSPTHASNSLSLSDGDVGRDFLIDDEIADQPALCFSDKHGRTLIDISFQKFFVLKFFFCFLFRPQKLMRRILNFFHSLTLQHLRRLDRVHQIKNIHKHPKYTATTRTHRKSNRANHYSLELNPWTHCHRVTRSLPMIL